MKLLQAYPLLIFLTLSTATTSTALAKYAMTGCNDTCGNVRIPYPFGIGSNCSVSQWYTVDCNSSIPYLPALNHLEVLGVNLEDQIVTVNTPKITDCQNPNRNNSQTMSMDLGNTPFLYSKSHNKFVFEGCGNAVMMDNGSVLTGCSTTCRNDTSIDINSCVGINCCQATIPHYLKSYNVTFERAGGDGRCGSAFLVDENAYTNQSFYNRSIVPVSLLWTFDQSEVDQISCCNSLELSLFWYSRSVDRGNNTSMDIQKCSADTYVEGTPYLIDGCEFTEECTRCRNSLGSCEDGAVYDVDNLVTTRNFTCFFMPPNPDDDTIIKSSKSSLGVILAMEEGRVMSIFDARVVKEGMDNLMAVANLAMRCLNLNGKIRPTMKEVAMELETIRMSHVPTTIQTKFERTAYEDDFSMLNYGDSTSTFTSTHMSSDDHIGH
ncbi:hypothetical protein QVD17_37355 [Tagetes erecta]|uniref:Uncharacterized protein n=1 Tax=Tagetes erecta TaxID=13708 RepID=A0AAD8K0C8_TARER|nr:hypothetical protein QVD17_37355 [Tagetes erecta]